MKSQEILKKYLEFFKEKGHKQTPNVSLVPEGDPTLLFVNSGMFPLVPYLTGEPHPLGKRLVNIQRSMRFEDLDEVGDNRHTTAFHMLGNWSLGDYFKEEQLNWVYEFLIEDLKLDPQKLYASVFAGDESAPKDDMAIEILKKVFKKYGVDAKEGKRIFAYGKESNWWQRGDAPGELGGPDSEIYYYIGEERTGLGKDPEANQDIFLEIGNNVFMQYQLDDKGEKWLPLKQKNIDFGGGFERLALVVQSKTDIFETDNFWPIIQKIEKISGKKYKSDQKTTRAMRIIADHIRTSVFLAMDGVIPSNKDQGYVLRRFIRRIVRFAKPLDIKKDVSVNLVSTVADTFKWLYPDLPKKSKQIEEIFAEEEAKFSKTLEKASTKIPSILKIKDLDKLTKAVFDLYQSEGYPHEMILDEAKEAGVKIDSKNFLAKYDKLIKEHQEKSRKGAEKKFKGGLADQSEEVTRYHTATHLLHAALREILGEHVRQEGSNITGERLRFDFSHPEKLTHEKIKKIEEWINDKINKKLPVKFEMMDLEEAEKTGALHFFKEKYEGKVKVYYIGKILKDAVSKEFCGGPHVKNTGEIGHLEIYKQEAVSKGIRRIYAKFSS